MLGFNCDLISAAAGVSTAAGLMMGDVLVCRFLRHDDREGRDLAGVGRDRVVISEHDCNLESTWGNLTKDRSSPADG